MPRAIRVHCQLPLTMTSQEQGLREEKDKKAGPVGQEKRVPQESWDVIIANGSELRGFSGTKGHEIQVFVSIDSAQPG